MATETLPTLEDIKALVAPFCERHGVLRLEVFGSFARGDMNPDSDIDLLVTFQPNAHIGLDFYALDSELASVLGRKVDLLTRRAVEIDPNFLRRRSILECTRDIYPA